MADAVIIHTSDKRVAADRLREAITAAGYGVGRDSRQGAVEPGPSSFVDKLASAGAVIVIWSKEALASDVVHSAVKEARRQGKLIEVSMDGIKPVGSAEAEMRVALLSGWRGEPFHPGWQKVQAELKRLCGSGRTAPPRAAPVPGSGAPASGPAAALALPGAGSFKGRRIGIVALAMLLLGSLAAAAMWLMAQSPPREPGISRTQRPAPAPAIAEPGMPPNGAGGSQTSAAAAAAPPPAAPAPMPVASPDKPEPPARARSTAIRAKATEDRETPRERRASAPSPSSTMRLFCERSGRGTRECRNYLRRAKESPTSSRRAAASAPAPAAKYKYSDNMRLFCEGAGRGTRECRLFRRRGGAAN